MKDKYIANFYSGGIFHVYNRTNNKEQLFKTDENRIYFLRQYAKYLQPFLNTFCWCLLPNHFHFLVSVKSGVEIKEYLQNIPAPQLKSLEKKYLSDAASIELLIELEWKRFFTAYSMAFNWQHARKGNLFHRPFKRVEVNKESHFTMAVVYIHANAVRHQLCNDFTRYSWSSWYSLLTNLPTQLCRNEMLEWFGGVQAMIDTHAGMINHYYDCEIAIEE